MTDLFVAASGGGFKDLRKKRGHLCVCVSVDDEVIKGREHKL